jgi:hypothetical protein
LVFTTGEKYTLIYGVWEQDDDENIKTKTEEVRAGWRKLINERLHN